MTAPKGNATHYMGLPYTIILRRDEEGDYIAQIEELEGCIAHGATEQEALENLKEAQDLWITDRLERGYPVPEPIEEETLPSGKWLQRVPRSLHRKLANLAKRESVSLNSLVTSVLSQAVGTRETREALSTKVEEPARTVAETWTKHILEHFHLKQRFEHEFSDVTLSLSDQLSVWHRKIPNRMRRRFETPSYGRKKERARHLS